MHLNEPNAAYRISSRHGLEGFEHLLRSSIENTGTSVPLTPTAIVPRSLDDLAAITEKATDGRYRLAVFSEEDPRLAVYATPLLLPWECYDPRDADIYVFGKGAMAQVELTERTGHRFYRPTSERSVAQVRDELGFLHRRDKDVFETARGDLVIAKPERLRRIAHAIVRPEPRPGPRVLN